MAEPRIVFLSYAGPDRDGVTPYFDRLVSRGFDVWMDYKRLKAGQNWDFEIRTVLDRATIIVVFMSKNSLDRRGYVQREIKLALDKAEENLVGDIYIIPVLLDPDFLIPDKIKKLHCVKAWEGDAFYEIEESVNHQLTKIGAEVQATKDRSNINWHKMTIKEYWEGLPGYEAEFNLLNFSSIRYPQVCDITTFLHGELIKYIMNQREAKFSQNSELMSFGQDAFRRTNTFSAYCEAPIIVDRIITIVYKIHWYGAGAAHPNMFFRTYAFFLDPVVPILTLREIFEDGKTALEAMQRIVRNQFLVPRSDPEPAVAAEENGSQNQTLFIPSGFDPDWVSQGTKEWSDFSSFVFKPDGIEILFAPYHVASYANGPQSATVKYDEVLGFMRKHYAEALGLGYRLMMMQRRPEKGHAPMPLPLSIEDKGAK